MSKTLKMFAKKVIPGLAWFLQPSPGDWIYNHSVLQWLSDASLRKQLPLPYQLFAFYSQCYFQIFGKTRLRGGRRVFHLTKNLFTLFHKQTYLHLQLPEYEVYLSSTDPRFLQVVNELLVDRSDTQVLSLLLSEGDTFIDVGANHGSFSIVASKLVGNSGRVISIEPQPKLAEVIRHSLQANALCKFDVYQVAVGEFESEIELLIPQDSSGSAGIFSAHSGVYKYQTVKVPLKCFDDLVDWQDLPGKILVKLDVEGSEFAFLKGAKMMISNLNPNIITEIHPDTLKASQTSEQEFRKLLTDFGYLYYSELNNVQQIHLLEHMNSQTQRNVILRVTNKGEKHDE
jgi:FkbM family methyltransferase